MASRTVIAVLVAVCAAGSSILFTPGPVRDGVRAKLWIDRERQTEEVKLAVDLFSATLAGFYVSGGVPTGLNIFPAEMLIKRRIFQDIDFMRQRGLVLAHDRDRSDWRSIEILDADHAVAVVDEGWFMQYQRLATRKPASNKKANIITVRYLLKRQWSKWIVVEYTVYGRDETLPPVRRDRVLAW